MGHCVGSVARRVGLGFLVALVSLPASAESERDRLNAFFEETHEAAVARWPEWQTSLGQKTNYGLWNDRSDGRYVSDLDVSIRNRTRLRHEFDFEALDPESQLNHRLFEWGVDRHIAWFPFRYHGYAVSHRHGMHKGVATFLINRHRIDTREDAEAYIERLLGVPTVMDQTIDRLRLRADKGVLPPRFVFPMVLEDIDRILTGVPFDASGEDTAMLADFRRKVSKLDLPTQDAAALVDGASAALADQVKPAYLRLRRTVETLQARSPGNHGVWALPDGDAFYAHRLRSATTTDLSPQEVHDYGLAEVARIHGEMRAILRDMDYDGDLQAFFDYIRYDPENFFPDTEEGRAAYLAETELHIARVRGRLDEYFNVRPKARLVVKRVEPYREKTSGIAFYNRPGFYNDRPGIYYVNLRDMSLMPRSHLEGLAYHEALPGHHMQLAIAQELEGLPKFRRFASNTAYVEGWALYAELLAKEMGFYRDPVSDFGRLSWELLRAARLVVDTGLHYKRWSREEAIAYLDENLPDKPEVNRQAIDRYLVWPAQATAYKIGMRQILELRDETRNLLGPTFDIKAFHDVVLGNGALPLDTLSDVVDGWAAAGGG